MILLADSGGTKTHWCLLGSDGVSRSFFSGGMHPLVHSDEALQHTLTTEVLPALGTDSAGQVIFYGAACSSAERIAKVNRHLSAVFPDASIQVLHDMLGVARSVCGNDPGMVAILGTGSNAAYYDGDEVYSHVPSLGYVLGDEGSGAYIGKQWIRAVLYGEAPADLAARFLKETQVDKETVLRKVYIEPNANAFLASFCPFLHNHLHDAFVHDLVLTSFRLFLQRIVKKHEVWRELSLGCVGSVAFHFKPVLEEAAGLEGVRLGEVIRDPMEGLVRYYSRKS
ncbi:MAG: ATPase [Flavobacteriales bacterium]|nr:hypothetical protein [Flavobacteriales bacterium]MCB9448958.1 ATPase [Flavobacteriales bacterium]